MTRAKIQICQSCARPGELISVLSVLDNRDYMQCTTCFDMRAETFKAISHAVTRMRWEEIPPEIRASFTVHRGDGYYMKPIPWMKLMLTQQIVPIAATPKPKPPPLLLSEDEQISATARRLAAKIKAADMKSDLAEHTTSILDRMRASRPRWSLASIFMRKWRWG